MAQTFIIPSAQSPIVDRDGKVTPAWLGYLKGLEALSARVKFGVGSPETVVAADVGTLYLNLSGGASTVLYIKEANSGAATGWTAK